MFRKGRSQEQEVKYDVRRRGGEQERRWGIWSKKRRGSKRKGGEREVDWRRTRGGLEEDERSAARYPRTVDGIAYDWTTCLEQPSLRSEVQTRRCERKENARQ